MKERHTSTNEVIGVTPAETTRSILAVDDRLIDTRINSLTGTMTITTGMVLLEPQRGEPGKILEPTHVLLLGPDKTHSRTGSINPRGLVHLTIQYSDDLTAKNLAVLYLMNSDSREQMTNLILTQFNSLQRTIQSMNYPTSAR